MLSRTDRRLVAAAALSLAALLAGCSGDGEGGPPAPEPAPRRWHVSGGFLRDAEGRAVILRGFNVSSAHKKPPYFDFHGAEDFARVRADWGMNAVRFLMSWAAIEPERGRYDEAYLAELEARVRLAEEAGLLVILDMHQDVFGEGFSVGDGAPRWACDEARYAAFVEAEPWFYNYLDENVVACFDAFWSSAELRGAYAAAWAAVAARLRDVPGVVGFDPMNEPFWGSYPVVAFEHDVLEGFYAEVIAAVRVEAPEWVSFIEPASSRNAGIGTSLEPFGVRDVVYAAHSYDAEAEAGGGFDPARRTAILENTAALAAEARALGAALWIGEYGGMASSSGIREYMDAEIDAAEAVLAGGAYWHYGRDNKYGFLDADGAEKPELSRAVIRPGPERVGGTPTAWSWDDAARRLAFEVTWADGDPSLIFSIPPRIYPEGASIGCSGCIAGEITEGRLEVNPVRAGTVRVEIGPAAP